MTHSDPSLPFIVENANVGNQIPKLTSRAGIAFMRRNSSVNRVISHDISGRQGSAASSSSVVPAIVSRTT